MTQCASTSRSTDPCDLSRETLARPRSRCIQSRGLCIPRSTRSPWTQTCRNTTLCCSARRGRKGCPDGSSFDFCTSSASSGHYAPIVKRTNCTLPYSLPEGSLLPRRRRRSYCVCDFTSMTVTSSQICQHTSIALGLHCAMRTCGTLSAARYGRNGPCTNRPSSFPGT